MSSETEAAPKFHCPYCGGCRLQVATSTQFSTYTNVTSKKVTTAVLSENTRYWCCADCGNTFPFPQDVEQQAETLAKSAAFCKKLAIFCAIMGTIYLLIAGVPGLGGLMAALFLSFYTGAALLAFSVAPSRLKQSEELQAEYEDLVHKCMD